MTDSELIILNFINDGLNYSYIIEKIIKEKKLRDYFELSFSSIYFIINMLSEKNYIETYKGFSKKRVEKKGIKITEEGKKALLETLNNKFLCCSILSHPLDYALYNSHNLTSYELKNGLNKYIKKMERIYNYYKQKEEQNENFLTGEKLVLSHFLSRIKNEIEWAKETRNYLNSIKNLDELLKQEKEKIQEEYRNYFI